MVSHAEEQKGKEISLRLPQKTLDTYRYNSEQMGDDDPTAGIKFITDVSIANRNYYRTRYFYDYALHRANIDVLNVTCKNLGNSPFGAKIGITTTGNCFAPHCRGNVFDSMFINILSIVKDK